MALLPATLPMPSTASDSRTPVDTTARRQEQEAFRRYRAAIVAARDSLRRAEELFDASSGAIDKHVQLAPAALGRRGIAGSLHTAASGAAPASPPRAAARAPISAARSTLSPVPARPFAWSTREAHSGGGER